MISCIWIRLAAFFYCWEIVYQFLLVSKKRPGPIHPYLLAEWTGSRSPSVSLQVPIMRGSGSCQIISAVKQQTRRCQIENRYSAWIDWLENVSCDECGKVVLISYNFLLPLLEHSNSAKCPGQLDETRCEQWGPSLLVGFWNAFGVVVFQNVVPAEKQFFQFRFRTRPSLNGSRSPSYFLDTLPVTGFLGTHSEAFISQIPLEHLQFGPMHEAIFYVKRYDIMSHDILNLILSESMD